MAVTNNPNQSERESLVATCLGVADFIPGVLSKVHFNRPIDRVELTAFAMFLVTESYTIGKKGIGAARTTLDAFHLDMTNYVANEHFLKAHPDASDQELFSFHDAFPEFLGARYAAYREVLRADIKPNTIFRRSSELLMAHLFTDPLTKQEQEGLLVPLGLAIAHSYSQCLETFK
jgi:hypothetical protein